MKRILLLVLFFVLGVLPLLSQNVTIPDSAFLNALIKEGVDLNKDGFISYAEAEAVTSLNVYSRNISDLTGIEAFVNLTELSCSNNQLQNLDLTNNTALEYLGCGENRLSNLDLTNNTALAILECAGNQLTSLNISYNTALWKLCCDDNQLTSLDVSSNTAIDELHCSGNKLTYLDITSNFTDFHKKSKSLKGGGYHLILHSMPSLHEVCVWALPFPPEEFYLDTTDSPNVYFTEACSESTEVKEYNPNGLSIYPNPTNNLLTIETDNPGLYSIEISSLNGQLIYCASKKGNLMQIDLTPFSKGIYFITVRSKKLVWTEKIIKL
ncbi:T9SS type A sorting domain-containing protein [Bacteroidota bacterium]